ncbi:MAG: hypothetical protein KDA42_14405, partial [Planctomycetales bacterium]|nr:hypothetical protein [Planctomycetales bacterium]
VFVSNFRVTPWVAWVDRQPHWRPCPREVDRVVEPRLAELADERRWRSITIERGGLVFAAPSIDTPDVSIWGASAMIVSELLEVVGDLAP